MQQSSMHQTGCLPEHSVQAHIMQAALNRLLDCCSAHITLTLLYLLAVPNTIPTGVCPDDQLVPQPITPHAQLYALIGPQVE